MSFMNEVDLSFLSYVVEESNLIVVRIKMHTNHMAQQFLSNPLLFNSLRPSDAYMRR